MSSPSSSPLSKLERLKQMTVVVADTGDIEAIRAFSPQDCTTNPTLILKAAQMPAYAHFVDEAIAWGRQGGHPVGAVTDRLAVNFGTELTTIVPGRVSTEVDADLSFDTEATVAKARSLIADYAARRVGRERILIKIASTWEGIRAAEILQRDNIDCNLTLLFSLVQAAACGKAGVFLVSPFVGRILDWYVKNGQMFTAETDPGVVSVREIYAYYKAYGIDTVVMGASFRNTGEIESLAGCDRLTISPQLLGELAQDYGPLPRRLSPETAATHAPARLELDEKKFRWLMNENAMATEKLAEGIRGFAKDLNSLRQLLAGRLNG
jgi:transaldolase